MIDKKGKVNWDVGNVVSWAVDNSRTTQRDLNRYYLLKDYRKARFGESVLLPGWFNEHAHLARPEKSALITSVKKFLLSYRAGGRLTLFRYLNKFFYWQQDNHYDYGTAEGVEAYIRYMVNAIRTRSLSVNMASQQLSVINLFLLSSSQIKRKYEYEFITKGTYKAALKDTYTRQELSGILRLLSDLNEFTETTIREHICRTVEGKRDFSIRLLAPLFSPRLRHPDSGEKTSCEFVIQNVIECYFITSFFLFCYHTWGNTTQVLGLKRNDIHMDEKGIQSGYLYKGRASKYIRLTIGKSEFLSKRAGYNWFLSFIALRDELVEYLVSAEKFPTSDVLWLSGGIWRNRSLISLGPDNLTKFNVSSGFWAVLRAANPLLPAVMVSRLRKTVEQYADSRLRNGLITTEKAQHDWITYRRNYAAGNPLTARDNLSMALDTLLQKGVAAEKFSERVRIADELGIVLHASTAEGVSLLLNGLGCRSREPASETEIQFMRKQHRFGRMPKVCADYANCVECPKSCIVESLESVWLLLSFKHAIEYGKPLFIGSTRAKEHYELLLMKIDLRLRLVDENVLKKARVKLKNEGVAEVWRV
ncbi:hypothetical protein ABGT23_01570 [Enterobacter cloacae]|uniref:hypothetical protein n=1 Tax=Enterobacter cloacae TaxID=550 RepID=UPI00345DE346